MKVKTYAILCIASSVLFITACAGTANTTANSSTTNSSTVTSSTTNTGTSNTTATANANRAATTNSSPTANVAPPPATQGGEDKVDGELQVGKTDSVILYFGQESGDYAGYCFKNDSDAGRAILAACKDREQCEVTGKVDYEAACKVPGLEADLSGHGRILSVASAKRIAGKKK